MAEGLTNGTTAQSNDIEMKEEGPTESLLDGISAAAELQQTPPAQLQQSPPGPPSTSTEQAPPPSHPLDSANPAAPTPQVQVQASSPAPLIAPFASMSQAPAAPTPPPAAPPARNSSVPPAGLAPPEKPNPHGSPTRVYLNQNVTPHLLEGMKYLAAYEPDKPLKWLSDFLARKSAEVEGDA